jgi:hypothetical protein
MAWLEVGYYSLVLRSPYDNPVRVALDAAPEGFPWEREEIPEAVLNAP